MKLSGDFRVCLLTAPNRETAEALARSLLQRRLAACVNLIPGCTSLYWWEGAICADDEFLMFVKTEESRLAALIDAVRAEHPYSCPEVLALPVAGGSPAYLAWLSESLQIGPPG